MNRRMHTVRRAGDPVIGLGVAAGLIVTGLIPATSVSAQPAPQRERAVIEEVLVTARRVEESIQDAPVSVAAFTQRELTQFGTSEISDIGRITAGLDIREQVGYSTALAMTVRGVGEGDTSLARDPTVGTYIDGVYLARLTGLDVDIVDLERVEVLRGPQGTLFGRNAIGGAVNIITEKPRGEWAFKQQASYGSREYRRFHTSLDTPTVNGLSAKLSFLHQSRDGLVNSLHTGRDGAGATRSRGFNAMLRWQPTETFLADYSFNLSRIDYNSNIDQLTHVRPLFSNPASPFYGGAFFETAAADASPKRQGAISIRETGKVNNSDTDRHTLTLEWDATPNLTIKSITSYHEWDQFVLPEFGTTAAPADGSLCRSTVSYSFLTGTCNDPVPAGELVSLFESDPIDSDQEQFTQEFQLIGMALDGRLNYTAGLYYFNEQSSEFNPQRLVFSAPLLVGGTGLEPLNAGNAIIIDLPFLEYSTDNDSYAAYANITYELIDDLDATLGLRYTRDKKRTELTNFIGGQVRTLPASNSWSQFNPALTLNYRWNEQVSTYAAVATGYRSGGYNIRTTNAEAFEIPFDEEKVTSYEIGWKSDLFARSMRFNGALYYMEYDDQQIGSLRATDVGAVVDTVNAGESVHRGMELDLLWLPLDGLQLKASWGYVDIDFKEFIAVRQDPITALNPNPGVVENISDTAQPGGPKHTASFAAEYQFAPQAWGQLNLHADASYTSRRNWNTQLFEFGTTGGHTLVNARATVSEIGLGAGYLRAALWVRNLLNKDYEEASADFGTIGFAVKSFGERRSFGVDLVYEFNR